MKYYLLMFSIMIGSFLFTNLAAAADQSPGENNKRWGITTKEPVVEEEDISDEVKGKDVDEQNARKDNHHDKKMIDREEDQGNAEAEEKDVGGAVKTKENRSVEKKPAKESQTDPIAPGKTEGIDKKKAGEASKEQKEKEALIKWKNESQKTKCNGYLASLKESFLKARYYSIQGVPCGTAEHARSFMTLIDQCKRDCPDEFLKKNGYTARIIRNLSWLEKLGSERCPDMSSN